MNFMKPVVKERGVKQSMNPVEKEIVAESTEEDLPSEFKSGWNRGPIDPWSDEIYHCHRREDIHEE